MNAGVSSATPLTTLSKAVGGGMADTVIRLFFAGFRGGIDRGEVPARVAPVLFRPPIAIRS